MDQTPIAPSKPSRIAIACARCKTRKHRCDGGKPKCGNCAARGLECGYAAVRRTRGPGKNKKGPGAAATASLSRQPPTEPTTTSNSPPKAQTKADFLLSGVYEHRESVEGHIEEVAAGRREYAPLLPRHIASRLIQNSFDAIMADYPLLDLPRFATLADEQYAACSTDPAGNPSRWALVNAVFALALRFKIAPGAENDLSMFPRALYQNAAAVLPELILHGDPSLLSVQALLAMAMFAHAVSDSRSSAMLTANASRQVELLQRVHARQGPPLPVFDAIAREEEAQLGRAYGIASALEALAAQRYGVRPLLSRPEDNITVPTPTWF
ncbi:hypothetical protein C8A01DRAFT_41381 [Parachaetomium inaequale]|uniref:Zn(2)-C6 fungal-type domain-containing protein n=1 Tax=Parachaetomium inaequale TaxID=2588326 RepID=A0AAN6SLX6_9PEZI|nr:hypothetical protein C8A01DRAFT_41381 [Parachaetomium inaequale]